MSITAEHKQQENTVHSNKRNLPQILILCTGNSCRSQMAEAYLNLMGVKSMSAGIEAHGLNQRAAKVMLEDGCDISKHTSKIIDQKMMRWADVVITVCGHADEHCPVVPPNVKKIHIPFTDPAKAEGSEEEILAVFREVRDQIRTGMQQLAKRLSDPSEDLNK